MAKLKLRDGQRQPFRRLNSDAVLIDARPGSPLLEAVEASRSSAERKYDEDGRAIERLKIDATKITNDARHAVLQFTGDLDQGHVPGPKARDAVYEALKPPMNAAHVQAGVDLFRRVFDTCKRLNFDIPEDCYWRLATLLRLAGNLREAIAVSEILNQPIVKDPGNRKVLATTRGGALLQLWEATGEDTLLDQAQAAFNVAWALSRTDNKTDEKIEQLRHKLNRALNLAGRT